MKSRPSGSWKIYSSVLHFGHPPVTWQLQADANVEDLFVRNCGKKKRYHMAVMVEHNVFFEHSSLTYIHLLNSCYCELLLSCIGRLFLPLLFLPCFSHSCLFSLEVKGVFSLVSANDQNILVLRESLSWVYHSHVTFMCCHKLERPAGPCGSANEARVTQAFLSPKK